jgi:tRNA (guanine-N7-)-methyltransferase
MRKKPNLLSRIERCGEVFIPDPSQYKGRWREAFPGYRDVYLEIGCGKGRFTVETALNEPDVLIVAIERVADAMIAGMERAAREDIKNVRFIRGDAAHITELFDAGEIGRLYLNFCDPWPGARHAKRRLTADGFLSLYRQILRPGGEIHFKTDNVPLFEFSLHAFERGGFTLHDVTRNLHKDGPLGVMTDYERKFHSQGVSINRCVAKMTEEKLMTKADDNGKAPILSGALDG